MATNHSTTDQSATKNHDSRPLYARRLSVELRIAELEAALFSARERHAEILRETERADTIPAPPPAANDNSEPEGAGWIDIEVAQ